jgi:toluene monooxygenase system protein D
MENAVGPVLRISEQLERVIQAIVDDNPGQEIDVVDCGAYVRIHAPHFMRLTRASLHRHVGPTFELRQLEAMMPSFAGSIETSSDEITWSFGT